VTAKSCARCIPTSRHVQGTAKGCDGPCGGTTSITLARWPTERLRALRLWLTTRSVSWAKWKLLREACSLGAHSVADIALEAASLPAVKLRP
jgi:hypothetical protein